MRLIECKSLCMFFRILIIMGCLYSSAFADIRPSADASNTNDKLGPFDLGARVSYVAPYLWRGIPLTQGPCIQPVFWASFQELSLGMFINMFGSNRDLKYKNYKELDPFTGPGSQSFGMINEVKLYLNWKHDFAKLFSLYTAYTHLAYAEHKDEFGYFEAYEWFDKRSTYGELTIKPSFQVGSCNIFTEQNLVILAIKHTRKGDFDTTEVNDMGNYHSVYGVTFEKKASEDFTVAMTISEELANKGFLSKMVKDKDEYLVTGIDSWGFYQTTINLMLYYQPFSWFSYSVNCGTEFITNKNVAYHTNPNSFTISQGALIFGGMHTTFTW